MTGREGAGGGLDDDLGPACADIRCTSGIRQLLATIDLARSTSAAEDRLKPTAAGSTPATGHHNPPGHPMACMDCALNPGLCDVHGETIK